MGNFIEIGSRAGEVVLFNKRDKVAVLSPKQAMVLSRMGEVLARAAIGANNARESGPTVLEMVDILRAVGMQYRSDNGEQGTWPRLLNLARVENEARETTYRKITVEAYNTLCASLMSAEPKAGEEKPVILQIDENGVVNEIEEELPAQPKISSPDDGDEEEWDENEEGDSGELDLDFVG